MKGINTKMEELEDEHKYIMVDGKPTSIKAVIDSILDEAKEKKRVLSVG